MTKKMTFGQFADYVNCISGELRSDQRLGQSAFNYLREGFPEVAEAIRGGDCDPFHNDKLLPKMLCKILDEYVTMEGE